MVKLRSFLDKEIIDSLITNLITAIWLHHMDSRENAREKT